MWRFESDHKLLLRKLFEFLVAGAFFAVLIALALWPLPTVFDSQFVGDYQGDFWKHLWGHWWTALSLSQGELPLFCRLINAPAGGYLVVADPFNALVMAFLLKFFSLITAYNLLIFSNLWLGCLAAWALAKHYCDDYRAALAGGTVYGLSAYVLVYPVSSGVTETLNTAWVPLFILFLHRFFEKPTFSDFLLAGLAFFLTTISCWYYGEFMVVYTAVALVGVFFKAFGEAWRGQSEGNQLETGFLASETSALGNSEEGRLTNISSELCYTFPWPRIEAGGGWLWPSKRRLAKWYWRLKLNGLVALKACLRPALGAVAAIILGAMAILPLAVMFKLVVSDPANVVMPDKAPKRSLFHFKDYLGSDAPWSVSQRGIQGFHNYTNLAGLFLMGKGNATVTVTIDRLVRVHYLGWISLFLAYYAWKRRRNLAKSKLAATLGFNYWLGVAVFFLLLSLGPKVTYSDFSSAGFVNPLYLAMFVFFPMFNQLAIPFRFLMLALLALAVLVSWSLKLIMEQKGTSQFIIGAGFSLAILGEILVISPLPWPLPLSSSQVPICYYLMAQEKDNFAIIDYPFERPNSQLIPGEYFYYQTVHGRAIPYRTSGVLSVDLARSSFMEEILMAQRGVPATADSRQRLAQGAEKLRAMGFRYFILHRQLLSGFAAEDITERLSGILPPPLTFGEETTLFTLEVVK